MRWVVLPGIVLAALAAAGWLLLARPAPSATRPPAPAVAAVPPGQEAAPKQSRPAAVPRFTPAFTPASGTAPAAQAGSTGSTRRREATVDEGVAEIHRPLYGAIRARQPSPTDKRAAMLRALVDSGSTQAPWAGRAREVFAAWQRAMSELGSRMSLAQPTCYRAGCTVEVRFADLETYRQASTHIRSLAEPAGLPGGRVLTPPDQRPGGEVIANWIMMAPAGS